MGEFRVRPIAASSYADDVDKLFFVLLALTIVFTVLTVGVLIYLAVKYRRGSKVDRSDAHDHNTTLEIAWSAGPLVLALAVFLWASKLFASVYAAPPDAKEIFVIGKQWMWHMQHASGIRENNELHLAVDQPIKLTMISQDVIHAFYVPEFRVQRHVEPGHYSTMWFKPTRIGKYHLYCNMYCGTQHSEMGGWVYVLSKQDYAKWATSGGAKAVATGGLNMPMGGLSMPQVGAALFQQYQCVNCHNGDAVRMGKGPSLTGIYGTNRTMANGKVIKADDAYLRNVLYYPNEYVLKGWPQGMPSYRGNLTEEQVLQINAYVKQLSGVVQPMPGTTQPPGPKSAATGTVVEPGMAGSQTGAVDTSGGTPDTNAPAADTDNQQWRYMYGGEQYK